MCPSQVAERHPYSVYRQQDRHLFAQGRANDPFTTAFGEGLPVRTYDRNGRARQAHNASKSMEQPYPAGYTGHVATTRAVNGQTYGRAVREAINEVAEPIPRLGSTAATAFIDPNEMVRSSKRAASAACRRTHTRDRSNEASMYASTSQLAYRQPTPTCYHTPAWSERTASNIGQADTYGHGQTRQLHAPRAPRRLQGGSMSASRPQTPPPLPKEMTAGGRRVAAPASVLGAAGLGTRPDIHLVAQLKTR